MATTVVSGSSRAISTPAALTVEPDVPSEPSLAVFSSDLLRFLLLLLSPLDQFRLRGTCRALRALGDECITTYVARRRLIYKRPVSGSYYNWTFGDSDVLQRALPLLRRLEKLQHLVMIDQKVAPPLLGPGDVTMSEADTRLVESLVQDVQSVLRILPGITSVCLAGALKPLGDWKMSAMKRMLSSVTTPISFTDPVKLTNVDKRAYHPDSGTTLGGNTTSQISYARQLEAQGSRFSFDLKLTGGAELLSLDASHEYVTGLSFIWPRVSTFVFDSSSITTEGGEAAVFSKLLAFPDARLWPACSSIKLQLLDLSSAAANDFVSSFLLPGGGSSVSTLEVELPFEPAGPLPPALISAMSTFTSLRTLLLSGRLGDAPVAASFAAALAALPQDLPLQSLSLLSVDGDLLLEPLLAVPLVRRLAREGRLRISFAVGVLRRDKAQHLRQLVEAGARRLNLALQGLDDCITRDGKRQTARKEFDRLISGFLAKCRKGESLGGGGAAAAPAGGGKKKGKQTKKQAREPSQGSSGGGSDAAAKASAPPPRLVSLHLTTYEPAWSDAAQRHTAVVEGLRFPLTEAECGLGGLFFSTVYTKVL